MSGPRSERIGFIPRLEASETGGISVQLGPADTTAVLRNEAVGRLRIRLPDGTDVVGEGGNSYDAFRAAGAALRAQERWIDACGNCEFFVFSHMSYQMSGGRKGYCTLGKARPEEASGQDVVSILDICGAFRYGPGARDDESGP